MKRWFFLILVVALGLAARAQAGAVYGADATLSVPTNAASGSSVLTLGQTGPNTILWAFVIQDGSFAGPNVYYGSQTMTAYSSPVEFDQTPGLFYVQAFYLLDPTASGSTLSVNGGMGDAFQQDWEYYTLSYGNVEGLGTVSFSGANFASGSSNLTVTSSVTGFLPQNPQSTLLQVLFVGATGQGPTGPASYVAQSGGTQEVGLTVTTVGDIAVGAPFSDELAGTYGPLTIVQNYYPGFVQSTGYGCVFELLPVGTPTLTPTLTSGGTSTDTPVVSATPTDSPTNSPVLSATPTDTPVVSATPTNTPIVSATPTDTPVVSATPTNTPIVSATPTDTPVLSATPTNTPVVSSTPSDTLTDTPVLSATPSDTPSDTPVVSATPTDTLTDTPLVSATPTDTLTDTPVVSATPSDTLTNTPVVSATPTDTPTDSPTLTDTPPVSVTPSDTPSATPTLTESPVLTATPTDTPTYTLTDTPVLSATPSDTPTGTPTLTDTPLVSATPTDTPSGTPTLTDTPVLSATPTNTWTASPTLTDTPALSATKTDTATRTETLTDTPVLSGTPSDTRTWSPTYTATLTRTPTGTPTLTKTDTHTPLPSPSFTSSRTRTDSPTVTVSPTITPTPFSDISVTLQIYDSAGDLLLSLPAGPILAPLTTATWGPKPYNPAQGPLNLSSGSWTFAYNGKNAAGQNLANGVYVLVLVSQENGVTLGKFQFQLTVVGATQSLSVLVYPNPVQSGQAAGITWQPTTQTAKVSVYGLTGGLVRSFGSVNPPLTWDLLSAGGRPVAPGIYIVAVRVPGQPRPLFAKLAVF